MGLLFRSGRRARRARQQLVVLIQLFALLLYCGAAHANPLGGTVVAGSATISGSGNTVTITQGSDRAVINWQGFSIGPNEMTQFLQPGANSAILNRVTGGNPSAILGAMQANGQVFLINPNGILVGPNAQINVGGLTASTLDISNSQFMQGGDLVFSGNSNASVVNYGTIRALEGNIYLIGSSVENHGLLQAKNGTVGLAAGQTVKLVDSARPHLVVSASSRSLSNVGVLNAGTIDALSAELAANGGNVYALAINNTGVVRATGSVTRNGRVLLTAPGGTIANSGDLIAKNADGSGGEVKIDSLSASAGMPTTVLGTSDISGLIDVSGVTGGNVQILGDTVNLTAAAIDASGAYGGGTVNIGGGLGGRDPALPNAQQTTIDAATTVNAGSSLGNGGQVVVWGTDEVNFHGAINTLGGDGGFVEVSTHGEGVINGVASTLHMLVDPGDVCVSTASTSMCPPGAVDLDDAVIEAVLNGGGTFELNTDVYGTTGTGRVDFGGGGNVTINNNTGTMGTFIIHAADTIDTLQVGFLTNGTTGTNYEWYAGSSSTANPVASARIDQFGQVFNTGGGHVIFDAADDIRIGDPLTTSGGDVTLIARGGDGGGRVIFRTVDAHIDSGGGTITIQTDTLQINPSATFDPLLNAGTGTVALLPTTAGRTIDLGTETTGSLGVTAANIDRIAADVLRFGSATSGNITISDAISPARTSTLSLITGGSIVDGNTSGRDLTVTNLALQSAGGVGGLETAVSNLAFSNSGGAVSISNSGALTIGPVDGITASSNTGTTTTITTASPITFAENTSSAGNLTYTAGESLAVDTDNITVNAGVTVQSTGGDVTLQAGDDVILGGGAIVSANGTLNLTAGFNDTDGDGGITTSSTVTLTGNPINLNAINDINLGLLLSAAGSAVNVTSTFGDVSLTAASGIYSFGSLSVTGNSINLGATINSGGAQTYNSPVLLTGDTILISTGGGNITFNDTVNGLFGLTVNTGGVTLFDGDIGTTTRIGDLTTDAPGSTTLQTLTLRTSGTLSFNDPVTGVGSLTIDSNQGGGNTTFASTIDGGDWIIVEPSVLTFGGAIGGTTAATRFALSSPSSTVHVNGGLIRVSNAIQLRGNVTFDSATNTTTLESTGGSEIRLGQNANNSVRSAIDGEESLIINTTGSTQLFGVIGDNNQRFNSITTNAGGTTTLSGGSLTLAGNTLIFNDAVNLTVDTTITDAGAVTFNNTVDGTFALDIDAGGDVTFNGIVGGTDPLASLGVTSGSAILVNADVMTDNGAIDFTADEMDLTAALNAGSAIVTLAPFTAGRTISLGAETVVSLSLTDAELDQVTADILRIGSADAGSITFNGAISPALTDTLSLITGDGIEDGNNATNFDVQVANLALQSVNGIADNGTNTILETQVDTLAVRNTTLGGISILESSAGGDLTVGTVDGVVGIRNEVSTGFSPLRSIQLETNNGDLTVNNDIYTSRRNMFLVAQQGNGGAGDSLFTNNANIINADSGASASNGKIDIRANNMTLSAGSTISAANRVILEDDPSATSTIAIILGGADGINTLGLTNDELNTVSTSTLQIGHSNGGGTGDITILNPITLTNVSTLDLVTGLAVLDGTAGEQTDLTVGSLAIHSGGGIGAAANDLNTAVTNFAFANTGGVVNLNNTGALTIDEVDGLTTSSNTGTTTTIATASPLTFAVNTSSAGSATYTAGEISDAPIFADDLTVNAGVTVSSTGGDLILRAGDEVILGAGSTASAAGALSLTAGFNDLDMGGQLLIDPTATLIGNPINLTQFDDFVVDVLNYPGITLNLTSTGGAIIDGNDPPDGTLNITAQRLSLSANTGVGGAGVTDTIETQVSNLEARTNSGGIFVHNTGDFTIGGVTGAINGVQVAVSGDISLTGTGNINVNEAIGIAPDGNIFLFSQGDLRVNANIRNPGAGETNLVAGWDGVTTDIATFQGDMSTYGLSDGSVFIGNGSQTSGIAVGSANGDTNVFGHDLTLRGSDTNFRGFAQLGFHHVSGGTAGSTITTGDIHVMMTGGITAQGGSQGRGIGSAYVQVGHGGNRDQSGLSTAWNYTGDITLSAKEDISFLAGAGRRAYAQLGNGGYEASGSHAGNVTIMEAADILFQASNGSEAYAQFGNGGNRADGSHSGDHRIISADQIQFLGGGNLQSYAQLGNGGVLAFGNHTGSHTIAATSTIVFQAGTGTGAYVQLGNGGTNADGSHVGNHKITSATNVTFQGTGENAYAQLGNGGSQADGDHSGSHAILTANDISFLAGGNTGAYAQLGNGGNRAEGNHSGDHTITTAQDIRFLGGSALQAYALLGNGGVLNAGNQSGSHTIEVAYDISFLAGSGRGAFAQMGNGGDNTDGNHSGSQTIKVAHDITFMSNGRNAFAQLGNGGNRSEGTHSGSHTIEVANDILFQAGGREAYTQFGNGGNRTSGNHSGDHLIDRAHNVSFLGGTGLQSFAQMGNGGVLTNGNLTGNHTIASANNINFQSGTGTASYVILGNGGLGADGAHTGDLTIAGTGDLTFAAAASGNTFAQLGNGGAQSDGNHSGIINVTMGGNATFIGGAGSSAYAQLGHGSASGNSGGTRMGDIDIRIAGETSLVNGAAANAPWLIGHATTTGGGISNANVTLITGTLDYSAAATSTLFNIPNNANGADFADKMIANLQGGHVTLGTTNGTQGATGGMTVASPFIYDGANNLSFLSTADIRFDASVQNGGTTMSPGPTGEVNVVAGWDGATGVASPLVIGDIFGDAGSFGISGGSVFIGDGLQTTGIAVGSRFGPTNLAAANLTLRSGESNLFLDTFAQLGFRVDANQMNFDIDGPIDIALTGDLITQFGRGGGYVQVGHGGDRLLGGGALPTGDFSGDITIHSARDLIFDRRTHLGHGGRDTFGDHSGDITIQAVRDLIFSGQLGHGGSNAAGDFNGAITIGTARDLVFTGRNASNAHLGHGGLEADGSYSGAITIGTARDLTFTAGTGRSFAHLGHGGNFVDGDHTGDITLGLVRNLTFTGATVQSYAQLGHGGFAANGDYTGAITVNATGDLIFVSGPNIAYAQLGHGGAGVANTGMRFGDIQIVAHGSATLVGSSATSPAVFGHVTGTPGGISGNLTLAIDQLDPLADNGGRLFMNEFSAIDMGGAPNQVRIFGTRRLGNTLADGAVINGVIVDSTLPPGTIVGNRWNPNFEFISWAHEQWGPAPNQFTLANPGPYTAPFTFYYLSLFDIFPEAVTALSQFNTQTTYDRFIRYDDFANSLQGMFPGGPYAMSYGPSPRRPLGELTGGSSP